MREVEDQDRKPARQRRRPLAWRCSIDLTSGEKPIAISALM